MKRVVKAGVFKAQCLHFLDEVDIHRLQYIITKRNRPVAKLIPIKMKNESLFGFLKGTMKINGDISGPT